MVSPKQNTSRATAPITKRRHDNCSDSESDSNNSHEHRDKRLRSSVDEAEGSTSGSSMKKRGSDVVDSNDEADERAQKRQKSAHNSSGETGSEESEGDLNDDGSLPESSSSSMSSLTSGPLGSSTTTVEEEDSSSGSSTLVSSIALSSSTDSSDSDRSSDRSYLLFSDDIDFMEFHNVLQDEIDAIHDAIYYNRMYGPLLSVDMASSVSSGTSFYYSARSHQSGSATTDETLIPSPLYDINSFSSDFTSQEIIDAYRQSSVFSLSSSVATSSDDESVPTLSRIMTSAVSDGYSSDGSETTYVD